MRTGQRFQSESRRPIAVAPQLWKRLIFGAAHEAKRTREGIPTSDAIMARWWLTEHRPPRTCKDDWSRSFDCACEMLGRDATVLRAQLVVKIDASLKRSLMEYANTVIYERRAMVLACAGVPTAICRQYMMPLVDEQAYDDVAGIDHGDQYVMYDQRERAEV